MIYLSLLTKKSERNQKRGQKLGAQVSTPLGRKWLSIKSSGHLSCLRRDKNLASLFPLLAGGFHEFSAFPSEGISRNLDHWSLHSMLRLPRLLDYMISGR